MKLLVRLYSGVAQGFKSPGIPDDWPAEVQEVADDVADPGDGRLFFADSAALEAYKATKQTSYDTWFDAANLSSVKDDKFAAVDLKTSTLIAEGFSYGGKKFSLSASAQSTLTGMYTLRDDVALTYPIKFNTLEDDSWIELANSTDVRNFYLTAVGTYRAHLDSGTALKDAVRAATTTSEVGGISDPR